MVRPLHLKSSYIESESEVRLSASLGHAVRLSLMTPASRLPLHLVCRNLWSAISLGQIDFIFDSKGIPVGFATWAFVTDECASLLIGNADYQPHLSEWNEGCNLWIVDFVTPYGNAAALARKLRSGVLGAADHVRGVRRYNSKSTRRSIGLSVLPSNNCALKWNHA